MNEMYYSRQEDSKDDWETPTDFFQLLDHEFHFTIDGCASETNHKCVRFFSKEQNSLIQDWQNEIVFVNPPFSESDKFLKKALDESQKGSCTVVVIIPARTDTIYFHEICQKAEQIRFCKGRVNFLQNGIKPKNSSTFPLMIVVFKKHTQTIPTFSFFDWKALIKLQKVN